MLSKGEMCEKGSECDLRSDMSRVMTLHVFILQQMQYLKVKVDGMSESERREWKVEW